MIRIKRDGPSHQRRQVMVCRVRVRRRVLLLLPLTEAAQCVASVLSDLQARLVSLKDEQLDHGQVD